MRQPYLKKAEIKPLLTGRAHKKWEIYVYTSVRELTGHQVMVRPARKYPPTVPRLVRDMD